MVAQALQEKMLHGNTGRILHAIDNTEALIGRHQVSFPRIAVFGDESTGKSSVLESICKIPFPRGKTTTTRCPTQVRLHRKPGATWSATAWAGGLEGEDRRNERHVTSPAEITKHISELQKIEVEAANKRSSLRGGANFSHIPITISVEADDVVDLTLVDLPGYFIHDRLDGGQGQSDDIERIKHTLLDYLCDPHTILLVIVPANHLVKTANIFNLLKEYEKDLSPLDLEKLYSRTIYCFTKCDLIGDGRGYSAPHNIEEMLNNEGPFSRKPNGWYAVVNNGGNGPEVDFKTRLVRDRQFEADFFARQPPFNRPDLRSRCGTHKLFEKLSSILADEISEIVPIMLTQTNNALAKADMDLQVFGRPPPEAQDASREFCTIVSDIKRYYQEAGEGTYYNMQSEAEDTVLDLPEGTLESIKHGNLKGIRCDEFQKEMEMGSLTKHLDDQTTLADILQMVREARNGKFEATMTNPEVLCEVVRSCAKKWKKLGARLCDDIAEQAKTCLDILVEIKAVKYERLPVVLREYLAKMIEEQRCKAHNRLAWIYLDEYFRPDSLNKQFLTEFSKEKNVSGLGPDKEANRNTCVSNLKTYLPVAEARYADCTVRTVTTNILDVPLGILPRGERLTSVPWEGDPKFVFEAKIMAEGQNVEDLMKVKDAFRAKRTLVEKKVVELNKLKEALLGAQPPRKDRVGDTDTDPTTVVHSRTAPKVLFANGRNNESSSSTSDE